VRIALVALVAWLAGIATALGYVALSGGAYEYRMLPSDDAVLQAWMRDERCEPRTGTGRLPYFRCPRFRLP